MHVHDPPVVANGVVYALQTGENTAQGRGITAKDRSTPVTNAILYAFDGETGKQLYSSEKLIDSWTHFSEPVVAGGQVYVSTWDGRLYAVRAEKVAPSGSLRFHENYARRFRNVFDDLTRRGQASRRAYSEQHDVVGVLIGGEKKRARRIE
jgi:outer membrane protein assembly factor BamB